MIILGIETSCDETAISILETREQNGTVQYKIQNNAVLSQIKLHEDFGGVIPMVAKREHAKNLVPLLVQVLNDSKLLVREPANKLPPTTDTREKFSQIIELLQTKEKELLEKLLNEPAFEYKPKIDAIAVTQGPGLEPALWVGVNFAKALSILWGIPAIPVNHMEGHIVASMLDQKSNEAYMSLRGVTYPALALLISGGHTELVVIKDTRDYSVIGRTRDDALGEAFDKVARLLGMQYPGGPRISALAETERASFPTPRGTYTLPRPMLHSPDYDFSFSGIKTAVLYMLRGIKEDITVPIQQQIAREFEDAVTEVIINKTRKAIERHAIQTLIIGGGVIANKYIRNQFELLAQQMNVPLLLPHSTLSTDNALMIALAGALLMEKKIPAFEDFKVEGNLSL